MGRELRLIMKSKIIFDCRLVGFPILGTQQRLEAPVPAKEAPKLRHWVRPTARTNHGETANIAVLRTIASEAEVDRLRPKQAQCPLRGCIGVIYTGCTTCFTGGCGILYGRAEVEVTDNEAEEEEIFEIGKEGIGYTGEGSSSASGLTPRQKAGIIAGYSQGFQHGLGAGMEGYVGTPATTEPGTSALQSTG